jgi:hypothetical protein
MILKAYLLSFGGVRVSRLQSLLYWLPAYEQAKMQQVYSLIVNLTGILALFV